MCLEETTNASYPLRSGDKKWTPEYRKEWNKQYRQKVKSGEIVPNRRPSTEDSRWNDPDFRKNYDKARLDAIRQQKFEEKTSFNPEQSFKHYSKEQKQVILEKMLDLIRKGEDYSHPHFVLTISLKDEFKYKRKTKHSSGDSDDSIQN